MYLRKVVLFSLVCLCVCEQEKEVSGFGHYKLGYNGNWVQAKNLSYIGSELVGDTKELLIKQIGKQTLIHGDIRNFPNLITLQISRSNITTLQAGCFYDLKSLRTLNLQKNKISNVTQGVFINLQISKLYLHKNNIKHIETGSFKNLPKLTVIKLNSNLLKVWDASWFMNVPQLNSIHCRRNFIIELPANAFNFMLTNENIHLYFSKNDIVNIHQDTFKGIRTASTIYLDRNNLPVLDLNQFSSIKSIEDLNVYKNKILKIVPATSSVTIHMLNLDKNPIKCIKYSPHGISRVFQESNCELKVRGHKNRKNKQ